MKKVTTDIPEESDAFDFPRMCELSDVRQWFFYRMKLCERNANDKRLSRGVRRFFANLVVEYCALITLIEDGHFREHLEAVKKRYKGEE